MKKVLLAFITLINFANLAAQNLVTNPGAEALPRGTGWTIISQGSDPCIFIPTNTFLNWTIIPDGTANYPYDHTTRMPAGTVFFAGCNVSWFTGVLELRQTVDVSDDAIAVDAGAQLYTFSGYIQTPVSPQTDQGRFVVDYLSAADVVLGTSYSSPWQSNFGGSGLDWNLYSSTRTAPVGTRKIRIRLQAEMHIHQPAINVYFDDISLIKPALVPVRLLSFTANENDGYVKLNWSVETEVNLARYEVERSQDGANFNSVTSLSPGLNAYSFTDNVNGIGTDNFFYRLKMVDLDGQLSYSHIQQVKIKGKTVTISPNPASDQIRVTGTYKKGIISITNASGITVLTRNANSTMTDINISLLPAGVYFVRYFDGSSTVVKKLLVQ
jgi:hypothetical protein